MSGMSSRDDAALAILRAASSGWKSNRKGAAMAKSPGMLAASDDSQRMILCCVLSDACEWFTNIVTACPQCTTAGFTCDAHWAGYEEIAEQYRQLRARLEGYSGLAVGIACPITADDRRTLTEALATATTYRRDRGAAEDAALIAAYEQLGRRLAAEPVHV